MCVSTLVCVCVCVVCVCKCGCVCAYFGGRNLSPFELLAVPGCISVYFTSRVWLVRLVSWTHGALLVHCNTLHDTAITTHCNILPWAWLYTHIIILHMHTHSHTHAHKRTHTDTYTHTHTHTHARMHPCTYTHTAEYIHTSRYTQFGRHSHKRAQTHIYTQVAMHKHVLLTEGRGFVFCVFVATPPESLSTSAEKDTFSKGMQWGCPFFWGYNIMVDSIYRPNKILIVDV